MRTLCIDLANGVSADMLVSACFALMNEDSQLKFKNMVGKTCTELGISCRFEEISEDGKGGFILNWLSDENNTQKRGSADAIKFVNSILDRIDISDESIRYVTAVLDDIIKAEAEAHEVDPDEVHLHEIGRTTGLLNIVLSGICCDCLDIHNSKIIASFISIGEGVVATEHGTLTIPTPAASYLLNGLRFRFGPEEGEMATPTGIALIRNLISCQKDAIPESDHYGIGFGSRRFNGKRGYLRIFIADEESGDS